MFERIVLRRSEDANNITLGELAEALLFYQQVHLILDRTSLHSLIRAMGIRPLIALLQSKTVTAIYCREMLATQTQKIGALEHHSFVAFQLAGSRGSEKRFTTRDVVEEVVRTTADCSNREARKLTEQFLELAPIKTLTGSDFLGGKTTSFIDAAVADVNDTVYLSKAISEVLTDSPGFSRNVASVSVEVYPSASGFLIFTNLDLKSINDSRSRQIPPLAPISMAHLLTEVLTARSDMLIAAHYGSDYKTSRTGSRLLTLRHDELLRRSAIHEKEKSQFQQVIVNEGRSLKEVIDSGDRSFDEFLRLLEKARTFKHWAGGIHPDASMVAEYIKEASREGWIGSLPGKGLRFVIGGALDLAVTGAGTAFGLADSLLVDKLSKGWRANHFVENRLKPFVNN